MQKKVSISAGLLLSFSIFYLSLPLFIFFYFWLITPIAIPAIIITALMVYKSLGIFRAESTNFDLKYWELGALIAFCIFICWVCGVGGYTFQKDDMYFRNNIIFSNLIYDTWPLKGSAALGAEKIFSYYLGYFLVPGFIGKYLGNLDINLLIFLWTALGLFLGLLLLRNYFGSTLVILLACFPSGIYWLFERYLSDQMIIIRYQTVFNSLAHGPQQLVTGLLGLAIVMWTANSSKPNYLLFLLTTVFFWSPFIAVGLGLICLFFVRKLINISWISTLSVLLGLVFLTFYMGKESNLYMGINNMFRSFKVAGIFIVFAIIDLLLILYLTLKTEKNEKHPLLVYTCILLLLIPFIRLGKHNDFITKVSIPVLFLFFGHLFQLLIAKRRYLLLTLIILIMSISSFRQILSPFQNKPNARNVVKEFKGLHMDFVHQDLDLLNQFYSSEDSFFGKYLMKK